MTPRVLMQTASLRVVHVQNHPWDSIVIECRTHDALGAPRWNAVVNYSDSKHADDTERSIVALFVHGTPESFDEKFFDAPPASYDGLGAEAPL